MARRASWVSAWLLMAVLAASAIVPQPAASETKGNGSLSAAITYSPDPIQVGDTVYIAILLTNTLNTDLSIEYIIYAGWYNPIATGIIEILAGANVSLTAQWIPVLADAGVPNIPLAINTTDHSTGSFLLSECRFINISAAGQGPLVAAVSVSPAGVHVNDDITVTVKLCNTGYLMLYDIHYVLYVGLGNYIASGNVPQLWPAAICESVPGGGEELKAQWIPAAPGTYKVGINASDGNGTASVVKTVEVVVSAAVAPGFVMTVTPASISVQPGTSFNVAASVRYNMGTIQPVSGKNTLIASPPTASFVRGDVKIESWVQICNCTELPELYIDGAFIGNLTPLRLPPTLLNGTYFELFEDHRDSSAATPGWHNLTVLGKHKEYSDTVWVFVNATCDLSVSYCPAEWTHDPSGINFTPDENAPVTVSMTFSVPAGAPGGTYSIVLWVTGPLQRMLAEAIVTVVVVNGTGPVLLADLAIAPADVVISPDMAIAGTNITVRLTVRNLGEAPGTGHVIATIDERNLLWEHNITIAAGGSRDLSAIWPSTAGNHTLEVELRPVSGGNRDGGNDVVSKTFTILPMPPSPRLILSLGNDTVRLAPGGLVAVDVWIDCRDNNAGGVLLKATVSEGFPVLVEIVSPPPLVLDKGESWKSRLVLRAPSSPGDGPRSGTVTVSLTGDGAYGARHNMTVNIVEPAPVRTETPMVAIGAAAAVSIVVVAAVAMGATEVGLVALMSLLLPLYSKIRKEEVLDQFTRGKIQGYITAYPGEHYNSIKAQLGMNNGALAYHLKVLEREGYVTSIRDGVYKRYYPKETIVPMRRGQFSQMQEMFLGHIRDCPGISQDGLARAMKVSNQVVYYHVRNLMAAGAVRLEKDGKETHCYLNGHEGAGDRGPGAG